MHICNDSEMDDAAMVLLHCYIQKCDETGMFIVLWYACMLQDMTSSMPLAFLSLQKKSLFESSILAECITQDHSVTGLKAFMRHITLSTVTKKGVWVNFMFDDHDAITAHSCANMSMLPKDVYI